MTAEALEKFISNFGIDIQFKYLRGFFSGGRPMCCISVTAFHEGNLEYEQHHCYKLLKNGEVFYAEGNLIKSVSDGLLGYLGKDDFVDFYFEESTRKMAKKHILQNQSGGLVFKER